MDTGRTPKRFNDSVAVVTGAARGIGRAVAERLAQEGAAVFLVDVLPEGEQAAAELRAAGLEAHFLRADVSDRTQVDEVVAAVVDRAGGISVLVNNAGLIRAVPFFEATERDMDEVLAVNVRGVFSFTQAVARVMVDAGTGGAIVNMSSIAAVHGARGTVPYSASKGAVSAMTRALAVALAEHGIRVNAVGPGSIETEAATQARGQDSTISSAVLSRTPLGRLGTGEEVAAAVAFLASEDAAYFTGQVLFPDGGRLALGYTVELDSD
ncbi:MAG: SDR family NAD(P)-dependent oxidoreductase [Mycetocola sp.]